MSIDLPTIPASTTVSTVSAAPTPSTKLDKAHADLLKASQQFESYFIDQMLKEMRKSIPKDEELGDSDNQQEIFTDMSDQAVADSVSKQGSFGVASMLYSELSKGLPPNDPSKAVSTYNDQAAGMGALPSMVDTKK